MSFYSFQLPIRGLIRCLLLCLVLVGCFMKPVFGKSRVREVKERVTPILARELAERSLKLGDQVYLRVFKMERILEVWVQPKGKNEYVLYKRFPIAGMSGRLGPKLKEGDYQAPEGFYEIKKGSLNPRSSYHLSFNIGYPNAYDRFHGRTGSFIMVHGGRLSAGCYAMTDPVIEEVYLLVEAALNGGQRSVPFHSFPYMMKKRLLAPGHNQWKDFWSELAVGYFYFEKEKHPPTVTMKGGEYLMNQ